jgi:hypothetical protein
MPCEIQDEAITSNLLVWFCKIYSFFEKVSNIKELSFSLIPVLVFFCFVFYIITRWQRDINKTSQLRINKLKYTGKYIEDVFIELNDSKELLRYYLHGKKWRLRIINAYNSLFNFYAGDLIKKNIYDKLIFSIPSYTSMKNTKKYVEKSKLFFATMRDNEGSEGFKDDTSDLSYYAWSSFSRYDKLIEKIINKIEICNKNHVLALGNAGNGKTNLLCSFSETVMKHGQPCVFIDAKEIKGDIEEFLIKEFKIPVFYNFKINTYLFFIFYSLLLFLKRKYLFVVVDALNENDIEGARDIIKAFFNKLGKYSRIKILVSCRSEYFNERFKNIFNEIDLQFKIIKINKEKYNTRAKEKALINYQKYFEVRGSIFDAAKDKLFSSLLLMRIFFEVSKGKDVNALELRNAEIYKQYIKQTSEKYQEHNFSINFQEILDGITLQMIKNNAYDGIPLSNLNLSKEELDMFKSMLDENLIINKKIKEGVGITEREKEIVYFVFDELRDFCISKKLLIDCEQQKQIDYKELFEFLNTLNKNKLSPLEGVLKYAYYYLKNDSPNPKRLIFCEKLLAEFGNPINDDIYYFRNNIFSNFSILMILADNTNIEEFELKHICKSMKRTSDFWNMLSILINNELSRCGLTVEIFLIILLRYTTDSIRDIIFNMTRKENYRITDESKELDNFCSKILHQDSISNEIKWILIIMNEIQRGNRHIEKCITKFGIGEREKENFIGWLTINKYSNSHIREISKLIDIKEDIK